MIAGFAVTAGTVGAFLDPFSFSKLVGISAIVATLALAVTVLALRNLEKPAQQPAPSTSDATGQVSFREALKEVFAERHTRRFATFVFISMLAYSAQDLVLEPFAGAIFGLTPGQSTQLGGTQHAGFVGAGWPLQGTVFLLGIANGVFAVAAIGSMMGLVSEGRRQRDGMRMGVWGAAQAIAFGIGGIAGSFAVDVVRYLSGSVLYAYSLVFFAQAVLFAAAAFLAAELSRRSALVSPGQAGAFGAKVSRA